jgi:hypothetical protein
MVMVPSRAWDVPEEFWIVWWRSRELRQLIIEVAVEPAGKGPAGKRSAPEFQRQVMDQMESYRRYPMRGPVALDLHFRAMQRNPPTIQRAVKHTLDVLGPALPGSERPRRRSVLYGDDRQVKFLYADLDQGWERGDTDGSSTSSVYIVAQRAADAVTDVCMAGRLHRAGWRSRDEEESPFWAPDTPEDPEPGWLIDPDSALNPIERFVVDSYRFHQAMKLQRAILADTDASLALALSWYLDDLDRGNVPAQLAAILKKSRVSSRRLLLSDPLTLPLPGLPRSAGDSESFARLIGASLEDFRSRWPLFQPLLVPLMLTFLVVPPEQGKDLDNIALTALPIAHKILRPHISPHLLSPTFGDDEPYAWRDEALARLKSVNTRSVRAYQVIELPRSAEDPPEGTLRLALGLHSHKSWWRRARAYVGSAIDRAERSGRLDDGLRRSVWGRRS